MMTVVHTISQTYVDMESNEINPQQPIVEPEAQQQEQAQKTPLMSAEKAAAATREEILEHLSKVMEEYTPREIASTVEILNREFKTKTQQLHEEKLQHFLDEGGDKKDFSPVPDVLNQKMSDLYTTFKQRSKAQQEQFEKELAQNALVKRNVIENIQGILDAGDAAKHYNKVRDLMTTWKNTGPVPRSEASEINGTYKKLVDSFFDTMKVAHELRDLDMKKNYEAKVALCERAEELTTSPTVVKAFFELRELQARWKTIGHVQQELREPIWQRFRAAADVIYANFRSHEESSKGREEENYQAKLALCDEIEKLGEQTLTTLKTCEAAVKQVEELTQRWRKIGFAPKAVNDEVYARFRKGCDKIYDARRAIVKTVTSEFKQNLEKKTALCEQAEALANSTDWSSTTSTLVDLQKQWKKIGPVPHKDSDAIWTRFRAACDTFFNAKEKHFAGDETMQENLVAKKALIEELKNATMPEDIDEHFKVLQDFQRRWNEIGYVPIKDKKAVNAEFSNLLNEQYDHLNTDDANRNLQRFKSRMEIVAEQEDGESELAIEQNRLVKRIAQAESDLVTLQNNVGFFAQSNKAASLIAEVNRKIKSAEDHIANLRAKLQVINSLLSNS